MHIRIRLLAGCVASVALVAGCESTTGTGGILHFAGFLSGAKVRPNPTPSPASGQAVVVVTPGLALSYNVTWAGLSGAPTGAHIHGPANEGQTADVLIDFSNLPAGSTNHVALLEADGSVSGTLSVSLSSAITVTVSGDSLSKLLSAGLLYVEVHTDSFPDGEIRTQLRKQ